MTDTPDTSTSPRRAAAGLAGLWRARPVRVSVLTLIALAVAASFAITDATPKPSGPQFTKLPASRDGARAGLHAAAIVNRYQGRLGIAVTGRDGSLSFYWNQRGRRGFQRVRVSGRARTFSAPSVAEGPRGETYIAVVGAHQALDLYSSAPGSRSFREFTVAPRYSAYSAPAITAGPHGRAYIAVTGPFNTLTYYWRTPAAPTFASVSASAPDQAFGAPAITTGYVPTLFIRGPRNTLVSYSSTEPTLGWDRRVISGSGGAQLSPGAVERPDATPAVVTAGGAGPPTYFVGTRYGRTWRAVAVHVADPQTKQHHG